ncbi:YceI family protein [Altererythrobacter sp. CC-YST694]|uniref:YceI family protein n=1 Tax=Altererythrobacter sp. CC-YST694 TaxID=2755038 RepID=UPI001D02E4EB|nr:YceI family protein [Altererythrobacter sp. CC-YST694]MCB5424382.1 YceI family protein [Altererythrobacter sp. CC-YST694]
MRKVQMGIAAVTGAALLYVVGAQAQNGDLGGPGKADASVVTAGTYAADPGHTLVGWKVNHFGFSDYFGIFGDVKGTLKLDPKNVAASSVEVTIPVSKVTTANAGLTGHLLAAGKDGKPADFFGAAPADATFKSTSVKAAGANKATITGDLTLNGVTKPVTINAEFVGAGANPFNKKETVGFKGTARIKRSEFNINYAVPMVTDTVDLDIAAAFEKQ